MGGTIDSNPDDFRALERRLSRHLNKTAQKIDPPEPQVPFPKSSRASSWMMLPAAAMLAVITIVGVVLFSQTDRGVSNTDPTVVSPGPAPTGPVTTATTTSSTTTGASTTTTTVAGVDTYQKARIALTLREAKITFINLETITGDQVPIDFDFSALKGEHLPLNPQSDGRGGFLIAVVDYDDSRPTRDGYLIHVPAGAERGVTLTEPRGIADMAVVESDDGWKVVYSTLLDSELKTWDLDTHGDPVVQDVQGDVFSLGGVSSGGGRYLVYWLEGCPAVRVFNTDGSEFDLPQPLSELGCNGVSREYAFLTPDGSRLVLLERNETEELVVVDLETGEERERWPIPRYGHLMELTDEEAMVSGSAGLSVVDLFTGEIQPVNDDNGRDPVNIVYDRVVLNPDLVIKPSGTAGNG